MKKNYIIIGAILLFAVLVTVGSSIYILSNKKDDHTDHEQHSHSGFKAKIVDACSVLTESVAAEYFGEKPATNDEGTNTNLASSDDINVSSCSFVTEFMVGQSSKMRAASLLARSAKTEDGVTSNQAMFDPNSRPENAQDVSGYGDDAYWDPALGQLSVLKNNNWYIIAGGSSTLSNRTIDDAKKLADLIINKL